MRQHARAAVEHEAQRKAGAGAQAAAQAPQVEKLEFAGKRKILLQQGVGRMGVRRLRQDRLVFIEAHFDQAVGTEAMHAAATGQQFDAFEFADQQFMQRHGGQQVAGQVQAQGSQFEFGHVDPGVAAQVEAQGARVFELDGGHRQRPQGGVPGDLEAAVFAAGGGGRQGRAARHRHAGHDLALRCVQAHLHHRHGRYGLGQAGAQIVQHGRGDGGEIAVEVAVHAGRQERHRFDQAFGMRIGRLVAAQHQALRHLRVARGEVGRLGTQVIEFAPIVFQHVVAQGSTRPFTRPAPAARPSGRRRRHRN